MATTRRTLLEIAQSGPEHERLEIVRDRANGVVLVADGQFSWAGDLAAWDRAAARAVEWEPHERCLMAWPTRQRLDMWGATYEEAMDEYAGVANAVAGFWIAS